MIQAGTYTIEDNGFTTNMETVGGVNQQTLIVELPGGITNTALNAFCAGPIEVLDADGNVTQTYTGPFRIVSHGLKFARASADSDVAVLTDRIAALEAQLGTVSNEKENAVEQLASLQEQLSALRSTTPTPNNDADTGSTSNADSV